MELAGITANKIIVMFVIVAIGMICYKTKLIDERTNEKLSDILLLLVSPLLIFTSYQQEFEAGKLHGLLLAILLAAVSHLISILVSILFIRKRPGTDYEIERFSTVYSNCGFMGIPLIHGIFGSEGVFYVTAYITVFNVLCWTHGVILMTGRQTLKASIKALFTPCIVAVVLGFLSYVCRIILPQILLEPITSVANMNTPLSMMIAGVSIASSNIPAMLKKKRVYYICFLRLLLIPLLAVAALKAFHIDEVITTTIIVSTACPTAASGTLFALRYHKNAVYASEIFGITTLLSLVTIPLIVLAAGLL